MELDSALTALLIGSAVPRRKGAGVSREILRGKCVSKPGKEDQAR